MTYQEARTHLNLQENEEIAEAGVRSLIEINEKRLKVWSLSRYDRAEIEQEIKALKALIEEEEK